MSKLSTEDFLHVVTNTPLVSIDFVIWNSCGQILIGKRLNEPARDYWFVPGGRILKGERIAEAVNRLLMEELGMKLEDFTYPPQFIGVYDHMYPTCFYKENPTVTTTHYIAIGYQLSIDTNKISKIDAHDQHSTWKWVDVEEMLSDPMVHDNTKKYIEGGAGASRP